MAGRTVEAMYITEADWDRLSRHLGIEHRLPPRAVYFSVAALARDDEIIASWASTQMSSEAPPTSVWSNWIVTRQLLGHTELTFNAPFYDSVEEASSFQSDKVTMEVGAAWARPLSSVVEVGFDNVVSMVAQNPQQWWSTATTVRLRFTDTSPVEVLGPTSLYQPAVRERWDQFVEAIRSSVA
ncbi:hypothetical protein H7J83_00140 [Mycobacterium mantenii]|uniref:Uncharacterized protein n=2 Tax=Mycobacterium mantenii TaxID=560555 RepID=A0A1X0F559_MYCNT|nr:hypothetical protein [Mycobacterium mantenii]MCV7241181.1 hypothetical protein [Mycobacterium mantenii]ORA96935.1 hypothetical protein BST30_28085 [Mycobacterium mantenii]